MIKVTIALACVVFVSTLACECALSAPRLQAPGAWNFGTIRQGENATGTVELKNAGDKELIIRRVTSSCGCTVAKIENKKLAPGESAALEITFTSGKRYGKVAKAVFVASNDPDNQRHRIEVRGLIKGYKGEAFVVEPESLDAGILPAGISVNLSGKLENIGDKAITVMEIAHSNHVACRLETPLKIEPKDGVSFDFTVTPAQGVIKEYIAFTTDRSERFDRVKRLYVSGYATPGDAGSIRLPASISVDEEGRVHDFSVLNSSRNDIEVSGLESEPGGRAGLFSRKGPDMSTLAPGTSVEAGTGIYVSKKDKLYITIGIPIQKRSEP
ncbi:MAG: DUF1573 domain-containing protein [Candidatus Tritonobacter lacicola]|nr:DUF1573 domain-containing protein [Candidatus Tritonobacter lacicola]